MSEENKSKKIAHKNSSENLQLIQDIIELLKQYKYTLAESRYLFDEIISKLESQYLIGDKKI